MQKLLKIVLYIVCVLVFCPSIAQQPINIAFKRDSIMVYPFDIATQSVWCIGRIVNCKAYSYDNGKTNTDSIVKYQGKGNYAARLCYDLVAFGYDDWYLPAINEQKAIYAKRSILSGFDSNKGYWSSTENVKDVDYILWIWWGDGSQHTNGGKKLPANIRCIRKSYNNPSPVF